MTKLLIRKPDHSVKIEEDNCKNKKKTLDNGLTQAFCFVVSSFVVPETVVNCAIRAIATTHSAARP